MKLYTCSCSSFSHRSSNRNIFNHKVLVAVNKDIINHINYLWKSLKMFKKKWRTTVVRLLLIYMLMNNDLIIHLCVISCSWYCDVKTVNIEAELNNFHINYDVYFSKQKQRLCLVSQCLCKVMTSCCGDAAAVDAESDFIHLFILRFDSKYVLQQMRCLMI